MTGCNRQNAFLCTDGGLWDGIQHSDLGGVDEFQVPKAIDVPTFFGLNVDSVAHPQIVDPSECRAVSRAVARNRKVSKLTEKVGIRIVAY